jgi:hypothetical protein
LYNLWIAYIIQTRKYKSVPHLKGLSHTGLRGINYEDKGYNRRGYEDKDRDGRAFDYRLSAFNVSHTMQPWWFRGRQ